MKEQEAAKHIRASKTIIKNSVEHDYIIWFSSDSKALIYLEFEFLLVLGLIYRFWLNLIRIY